MGKKQDFIKEIEALFEVNEVSQEARDYFEKFKEKKEKTASEMTENGAAILKFMQENHEAEENLFTARAIAEGLFWSSRSVSGSIRKLVTDGYVSKTEDSPIVYSLTEVGKTYLF